MPNPHFGHLRKSSIKHVTDTITQEKSFNVDDAVGSLFSSSLTDDEKSDSAFNIFKPFSRVSVSEYAIFAVVQNNTVQGGVQVPPIIAR